MLVVNFIECVQPGGQHTLHILTDASSIGFGVVAYVSTVEKNPSSSFLCAKSKLKGSTVKSTIPKTRIMWDSLWARSYK